MDICFCLMPVDFQGLEILKPKEIQESTNDNSSFFGLGDQNESEIKWVKLHQMFDK